MSYFDDQMDAWFDNNCKGRVEDYTPSMDRRSARYIDTGDITSRKHKGNAASRAANERNLFVRETDEVTVYGYLCATPTGLTSKEIAAKMGKEIHQISGRLSQLKADGKVRGTGERRDGAEVLVSVTGEQQALGLEGVA